MTREVAMSESTDLQEIAPASLAGGFHGVRYQVKDVARALSFDTEALGFKLERQQLPKVRHRFPRTSPSSPQRSGSIGIASHACR